jgi:uncharacterized radical SAM protein YgiQ
VQIQKMDWLPITQKEVDLRNWDELDVILITGDAYIDHPSFGVAVIGRILESMGIRVAVLPQPNWRDDLRDFKKFGKPRLFFGITAGNMDSMVNHYTAQKRLRSNDAYTPGGESGFRPDYACTVYSSIVKQLYPNTPVILGGIEASLRRVTHYDYWSDSLKPSILLDSRADLLVYGMGEKAIREVATLLQQNVPIVNITGVLQTAYLTNDKEPPLIEGMIDQSLHSHEVCLKDKIKYAENFKFIETESNRMKANRLVQKIGEQLLVINPPYPPFSEKEMDASFDLPYTRLPHPKYEKRGKIPAYEMIKFSINAHRGCFGGCSFCTISAHQGKFVVNRSESSILKEVEEISKLPDFKGHITDIGGPSANMYKMKGFNEDICMKCKRPSCIFPTICKNLNTDHTPLTNLYRKVRELPYIKKLTIGSGLRYDLLADNSPESKAYKKELILYHVSGRLKVAPEHTSDEILKTMRKPSFELFKGFLQTFNDLNKKYNLKQQLIPYFISGHPLSKNFHMKGLSQEIQKLNIKPEQVQDFTPTPMTLATEMYYSGINPYTGEKVYTEKNLEKKKAQKENFFWYKK